MKYFVLPYTVLFNLATSSLLIIMTVVLTRSGGLKAEAMLYAYYPYVGLSAIKLIADVIVNKSSEGNCTLAICKMVLQGLCLLSLGLGLRKLSDNTASISWPGLVVPLWIVTALFGSFLLMAIILFVIRFCYGIINRKCFTPDVHASLWSLLNIGFIMYLGIHLLLVGPAFGEGKKSFDSFLTPAMVGLIFSGVMCLWMGFGFSKL